MDAAKYSSEQWIAIPPKMIQSPKFRNRHLGNVIYEHSDADYFLEDGQFISDYPTEENEQL